MSTSSKVLDVILKPEDVPGATLPNPVIENNNVVHLKRWLECRDLKRDGRKRELVACIQNCINNGGADRIYPGIDNGIWREKKLKDLNKEKKNILILDDKPTGKWGVFPSFDIPPTFNKGHMYHYFIESCPVIPFWMNNNHDTNDSDEDSDCNNNNNYSSDNITIADCNTEKPFRRGKQFVDSKHVCEILDNENDRNYFLKAKKKASMKQIFYDTSLMISKRSGYIMSANCNCKQSSLGRCSHISALCQYVFMHTAEHGCKALPGTSKHCAWKDSGKREKDPDVIDTVYGEKVKIIKRIEFDPRPTQFQLVQLPEKELINRLLYMVESSSNEILLWSKMLKYQYEDFAVDDELKFITEIQVDAFMKNLVHLGIKNLDLILIENTEEQSSSPEWQRFRKIFFTASECKQVLGLTTAPAVKHYLQKKLWGFHRFQNRSMKYGLKYEPQAFEDYIADQAKTYDELEVVKTGLWFNKKYLIGCSPDGVISRKNQKTGVIEVGLLEIKCPEVLKNVHPKNFTKSLNKQQLGRFFLKNDEKGKIVLKKTDKYYYQIQLCLGIHQLSYCDLAVWSKHGILIVPVPYDDNFFQDIARKLRIRYRSILLPEYFLMRTVRDLNPYILYDKFGQQ